MTKTKSHWFRMVYIEVQDKKLKSGMKKMSYKLFRSIDIRLILVIFDQLKIAYQQISANVKRP